MFEKNKNMKRIIIKAFATLVVCLVSWYAFWSIKVKLKYDKVKADLSENTYHVMEINDEKGKFLNEIQKKWRIYLNIVNGGSSEGLKLIKFDNSVSGILKLLTYHMPEYSWFSTEQTKKQCVIASVYCMLAPQSVDNIIYVSKDMNLAFIQINEGLVLVYQNDKMGLREILYVKKIEQSSKLAEKPLR